MSLKYILRFCFFLIVMSEPFQHYICVCVCVLFSSFYDVLAFLLKMEFQLVVCKSEWEPERCTQILRHGICCNFLTFIDNVWCEYGSRSCVIFTLRAIQWFPSTSHFLLLVRSFSRSIFQTHTHSPTTRRKLMQSYLFDIGSDYSSLANVIYCVILFDVYCKIAFFNAFWHILGCCSIANFPANLSQFQESDF